MQIKGLFKKNIHKKKKKKKKKKKIWIAVI